MEVWQAKNAKIRKEYDALNAKAPHRTTALTALETAFLANEMARVAQWERRQGEIERETSDLIAGEYASRSQALAELEPQFEARRLELNAALPPEKPRRAAKVPGRRPGRPAVQRERAMALIAANDGARVAALRQAAADAGIMWKTMEAAAQALGVRKGGRRWTLRRNNPPN
jgi:hypothetical protein